MTFENFDRAKCSNVVSYTKNESVTLFICPALLLCPEDDFCLSVLYLLG